MLEIDCVLDNPHHEVSMRCANGLSQMIIYYVLFNRNGFGDITPYCLITDETVRVNLHSCNIPMCGGMPKYFVVTIQNKIKFVP